MSTREMWQDEMIAKVEALEAEEARLSAALLDMASERDVALEEVARLRAVLDEIEGGACYTAAYHSNCDGKCKDIARAALKVGAS